MLDQENLTKWQPDLVKVEHLSGVPGEVGAKTNQVNRQGRGQLEIVETITTMRPPDEFSATYEAGSVWTLVECRFYEIGKNRTRWVLTSEFRSTNVLVKLMTLCMPGMFRKQTTKYMQLFKDFAEASG
jgi:hypothetical protein